MTVTYTYYARLDETILVTRAGDTLIDRADSDVLVVRGDLTDITADVLQSSAPSWTKGSRGKGPQDRIATTGSIQLSLKNSATNIKSALGAYSPDHSACRAGWGLGTRLLVKQDNGTYTKYTLWRVASIEPTFGQYRERRVNVRATDYMDYLASQQVRGLEVQLTKRGDEVIHFLLDTLPVPPVAESIGQSDYTFPTSLDASDQDERTTVYSVLNKVCLSDFGYIYCLPDSTGGELISYESSTTRAAKSSIATFDNTMSGLTVKRDASKIYNDIRVTTYPRYFDAGTTVLCNLDYELSIPAGGTVNMTFRYTDPDSQVRVAALETFSPDTSIPDYRFTGTAGGTVGEMNTSLSIMTTPSANSMDVQFTNSAASAGYLNLFAPRGRAIRTRSPVESMEMDQTSIYNHGRRALRYQMPYQSDPTVGGSAAVTLLAKYKDPSSDIDGLIYYVTSATLEEYALNHTIGDKITISEAASGLSSDVFYIISEKHTLNQSALKVEYGLIPI